MTVWPAIGFAQPESAPGQAPTHLTDRAARRFPQPVRVGDLHGRKLLGPAESQPVLGRVTRLVRRGDGGVSVVVRLSGWFTARSVAIPVDAIGLLGEHVVLLDLTQDELRALPATDGASTADIPSDQAIRVGLAKPFH